MRRFISGTAAAASGVLTVTRTSSDPASASSTHCRTVATASAVSVIVIDWTTTGAPPPTRTFPTLTPTVLCSRTLEDIRSIIKEARATRPGARSPRSGLCPAVPQENTLDVVGARQRQGDGFVIFDPVHDPVEEPRNGGLGGSRDDRRVGGGASPRHPPENGRIIVGHPVQCTCASRLEWPHER